MELSSKQVSRDQLELSWTQTMPTSGNMIQSASNQHSTKTSLQTQQSNPSNCPRCDSTNTKFCYYNNYNKTQPRHYCKACKRHWTKGGTLRNVPVGGGRKNKRFKSHNINTTTTSMINHSLVLSDQKYMFPDEKGLFFKPNDTKFDQVSWDFNGANATSSMQQLAHDKHFGFSIHSNLSSNIETNPIIPPSFTPLLSGFKDDSTRMMEPNSMQVPTTSNFLESNYWTWNEIDSMVQADHNKPFDDPNFRN